MNTQNINPNFKSSECASLEIKTKKSPTQANQIEVEGPSLGQNNEAPSNGNSKDGGMLDSSQKLGWTQVGKIQKKGNSLRITRSHSKLKGFKVENGLQIYLDFLGLLGSSKLDWAQISCIQDFCSKDLG